jgi:flagellar biosynthesis protein FlhB
MEKKLVYQRNAVLSCPFMATLARLLSFSTILFGYYRSARLIKLLRCQYHFDRSNKATKSTYMYLFPFFCLCVILFIFFYMFCIVIFPLIWFFQAWESHENVIDLRSCRITRLKIAGCRLAS